MMDILDVLKRRGAEGADFYDTQLRRFVRFAEQQERMIGPDGTYPPVGRSIAYRLGAFHALAQVSLMKKLPKEIKPAQVRCALTKAMKRQLVKGTYDKDGWLTLGFCGHQPRLAEKYVSTGSLYMCTLVFLPLGLDAMDEFWSSGPACNCTLLMQGTFLLYFPVSIYPVCLYSYCALGLSQIHYNLELFLRVLQNYMKNSDSVPNFGN